MITGRPTKYRKSFCRQAAKLCMLGAIDKDLADFFEVSIATINNWKLEHEEFLDTIKEAKEELDNKVVRSLFERATGYSCKDTKFATLDGKITDEREYDKNYPPDSTAAMFWLKNRQPENWRDQQYMDTNLKLNVAGSRETLFNKILPKSGTKRTKK